MATFAVCNKYTSSFMENIIPNLSVDCVVFGFGANKLNVLLKERKLVCPETGKCLIDDFTLTGFHVFEGEDLDTAWSSFMPLGAPGVWQAKRNNSGCKILTSTLAIM